MIDLRDQSHFLIVIEIKIYRNNWKKIKCK
jgi:hypothetical protein